MKETPSDKTIIILTSPKKFHLLFTVPVLF